MIKDQCISVTELRTRTKKCLQDLEKEPKYIFINNHPIAVLLDIRIYEEYFSKPELMELSKNETNEKMIKKAKVAKKSRKSELINI